VDHLAEHFIQGKVLPMSEHTINFNYTSDNFWSGSDYVWPVKAICNHGTARTDGSSDNSIGWLCNPNAGASANYVIDTDGTIYCLVNPYPTAALPKGKRAWANGILKSPNRSIKWIAECDDKGWNPNWMTISIEHVADNSWMRQHRAMPPAQEAASLWLNDKLARDFGLDISRESIIGHCDIDSVTRHDCPGVINLDDRVAKLKAMRVATPLGTPVSKPAPTPTVDPENPEPNRWVPKATGFEVNNVFGFLDYWRKGGGIGVFGYPITGARGMEGNPNIVEQYFERARLEYHLDDKKIYSGRDGAELLEAKARIKALEAQLVAKTTSTTPTPSNPPNSGQQPGSGGNQPTRRVMGLHVNNLDSPKALELVRYLKPALIMAPIWPSNDFANPDTSKGAALKALRDAAGPDCVILSRYGVPDTTAHQEMISNPIDYGRKFGAWTKLLADATPKEANIIWAGLNEVDPAFNVQWADWQFQFNNVMSNYKVAVYGWGSGSCPTDVATWQPLIKGLQQPNVAGIIEHEYWAGNQLYDAAWNTWRQYRFVRGHDSLVKADAVLGNKLTWFLGEVAFTGNVGGGDKGWRNSGLLESDYAKQITDYASAIRQYSYVAGAALFCFDDDASVWSQSYGITGAGLVQGAIKNN
jgi:N-acetyl-anhydromuramyl-L-alanine amidase AmpD